MDVVTVYESHRNPVVRPENTSGPSIQGGANKGRAIRSTVLSHVSGRMGGVGWKYHSRRKCRRPGASGSLDCRR